jgi:small-conductance mechanosensitive channel
MQKLLERFDKIVELKDGFNFLGNPVWHWLLALTIAIVVFFLFRFIFNALVKQIDKIAKRVNHKLGNIAASAFKNSKFWFFAAIAIFFSTEILNLGEYDIVPLKILTLAIFAQIGIWLSVIFSGSVTSWSEIHNQNQSQNAAVSIIKGGGKFLIWTVILLLTLDNIGIKVVSLLTGLGVGGIAIALAVQKILGDLFASISIMIDKPFEVGDFINIDSVSGTVESIGIKTTRIRSATGEQVIIANSDLLGSRVSNFKRMQERRITFGISVSNKTAKENLLTIVTIVKNIIESQENVRFDRGHLKNFSASSVDYEFVFWVTKPDYISYMDIQQKINLALISVFEEKKIHLAHTVQKLLLERN